MKKVGILLVLIFVIVGGNLAYWSHQLNPVDSKKTEFIFELRPGSFKRVAQELQDQGIIRSAGAFSLYARLQGKTTEVRVGEYALNSSMTASEVLETITTGKSITYDVTFQEGLNMFEYAKILASKKLIDEKIFLDLARNPAVVEELLGVSLPSLEGYLFPETYKFTKFTGEKEILNIMVGKTKSILKAIDDPRLKDAKVRQRFIILASIIEKETGAGFERDKVSSVFHNRIEKKMKLQSDPTIIYGAKYDLGIDMANITRRDISKSTRFNTYTVPALPYGPVSNPGREAIIAALHPAKTEYLYFVSYNNGTHYFSKSYKEHLMAVKKYQIDPSGRKNKSWRDLKKKK